MDEALLDTVYALAPRHLPAPRPRALSDARFLQRDRAQPCRRADGQARAAPGARRGRGDLLLVPGGAVRPLLGRGRRLSQPALRDLLPPGHRVLHRAAASRASSPAPRASTRCAAASCRPSPGRRTTSPIARFRAAIARLPARARRAASMPTPPRCSEHVPYRDRRREHEDHHLAVGRQDAAGVVSAARAGAR